MIELNKKRLIPQKQIESILSGIRMTQKNIYETSLPAYLAAIDQLVPLPKAKQGKEAK